ncbi:MAG: acyl-CoA dehydrogenase family protein [Archaeoglobus sp.]|nr:acyl-CoA dehydrogenase family protein [Archaeoglobus sp.]
MVEEVSDIKEGLSRVLPLISKKSSAIDKNNEMYSDVLQALFDNKLMSILAPKEYGGFESYYLACLVAESVAKINAGVAHSVVVHNATVDALRLFGTAEQKEKWLPKLKKKAGTLAMTEPSGGSDVSALKMEARKEGDVYILNGRKTLITNASFGGVFIVIAKTEEGLTAFITEKDGVVVTKLNQSGMRGSGLSSVGFSNVEVAKEDILGGLGKGLKVALGTLSPNRIPFAAMGLGIAETCLESAIKYAKGRTAFGKKVADFQGIQWMIAELATEIETLRSFIYNSAEIADGKESSLDVTTLGAMCKLKAAEIAKKAAEMAVEIYGGHGVIVGSPVERAYRDAKLLDIAEGTSEIMKVLISRTILGR